MTVSPSRNGYESHAQLEVSPLSDAAAERAVLGAIIADGNNAFERIAEKCSADDFYTFAHQLIFRAAESLHKDGLPIEAASIAQQLRRTRQLDDVKPAYLVDLHGHASASPGHYAAEVRRLASCRRIERAGQSVAHLAAQPGMSLAELNEAAQRELAAAMLPVKVERRLRFTDSAEFLKADFKPAWLVQEVLVSRQPAVVGAAKKNLKTSCMVDLGVSLATGTAFLGYFPVPEIMSVGLVSGESGGFALQQLARRVCEARGVGCPHGLYWSMDLPQLSSANDLAELRAWIKDLGLAVVIIDPLYLCLLGGVEDLQASNLYQIGPLLRRVGDACLDVGAVPILVHHFRQTAGRQGGFEPPQLGDLAFSGIQEYARQWILLGRRDEYLPGSGEHRLWLVAGGSAGHAGQWALDIRDGVLGHDFSGRTWDVTVKTASDERQTRRQNAEVERREREKEKHREQETQVLKTLDAIAPGGAGIGFSRLRDDCGLGHDTAKKAISRLVRDRVLEECETMIPCGHGKKKGRGIRRRTEPD